MSSPQDQHWVDFLAEEDLAFVKRFILCSGSLKDLATAYDVSYPTLRLRLDRLIEKGKILDNQQNEDPYERMLGAEYADGKVDPSTFKRLLSAYRNQRKAAK